MEGSSEHLKKSTKNSTYSTWDLPHDSLVHAGGKGSRKTPQILPNSRRYFSGASSTDGYKVFNTSKGKINRPLDIRAADIPGEGGILWAQLIHQHICVRGDTGWRHQSSINSNQTFDSTKGRDTNRTSSNQSNWRKHHLDSRPKGRDRY